MKSSTTTTTTPNFFSQQQQKNSISNFFETSSRSHLLPPSPSSSSLSPSPSFPLPLSLSLSHFLSLTLSFFLYLFLSPSFYIPHIVHSSNFKKKLFFFRIVWLIKSTQERKEEKIFIFWMKIKLFFPHTGILSYFFPTEKKEEKVNKRNLC